MTTVTLRPNDDRRCRPPAAAAHLASAAGDPAALLEAIGVDMIYGQVHALSGASLAVAPGEWVAITGPSGSGKSTLIQLCAALDRPTCGLIRFQGSDLGVGRGLDQYRRMQAGLVFQLHNLLPHLDAIRNIEIAMFGTHRNRRARRKRAVELLALVDLQEQAHRTPPEMSGGERQRVAIARALANEPMVVLADEPTGSLDQASVANVVEVFGRLHREEGTTIVMVTHDMDVARAADRIVRCEAGRISDWTGASQIGRSVDDGARPRT